MSHTNYELRNITLDPKPPPSIAVVLSIGYHPLLDSTCKEFASCFSFQHISIQDYLDSLLHDTNPVRRQQALSPLHPYTLANILEREQRVPADFLIPIIHRKIHEDVGKGYRRFVITGLAEDVEAARQFSLKVSLRKWFVIGQIVVMLMSRQVAAPIAVFAFLDRKEEAQQRIVGVDKLDSPRLLIVRAEKDEGALFPNLLSAIGEKVWDGDVPRSRLDSDRQQPAEYEMSGM